MLTARQATGAILAAGLFGYLVAEARFNHWRLKAHIEAIEDTLIAIARQVDQQDDVLDGISRIAKLNQDHAETEATSRAALRVVREGQQRRKTSTDGCEADRPCDTPT